MKTELKLGFKKNCCAFCFLIWNIAQMKPFYALMLNFRITAHIISLLFLKFETKWVYLKMKFEQKCSFLKNWLRIFFPPRYVVHVALLDTICNF